MTPASSKTQIIWLEDRIRNLEERLKEVERLNKPPTKLIATRQVLRQAGWMPIPKPLTDAYIDDLCDEFLLWQIEPVGIRGILHKLIRAVELAHGIGEKDDK
jgi:hypothetical protein